MSQYTKEQLQEIKSKIDYFEFYKQYLPELKRTGANRAFSACCWHVESRPSLCIDLNYGLWRCFGSCNTGGDIFSFYQKFFNVSFSEAVQDIAEMYGVELVLDEEIIKEREHKKGLYNINNIMCNKFIQQLEADTNAWNYLTQIRGLSPKIIQEFKIGCGLNKIPEKESLKTLGLLVQNEKGEWYSKFRRDRVVFPRFDEHGNIVSFTGRLCIEKDGAKYMHTSNTEIYNKSEHLFGLYQAKKYIKHFKSVICVEGEIDLIKCHQKSIVNSVAVSGLNISDHQVNLLKKYTSTFYVCVEDGAILKVNDNGVSPLSKFYDTIKKNIPYAKVYIVDLRNEDGSKCDPDMYLSQHTREEFTELVKHAKIYNEFVINCDLKKVNPKNIEEKTACINFLIPKLASIQNFLDRKQYIELVANKLSIPENDIYRKVKYYNEKQEKTNMSNITWDSRPIYAQKILLSTCFAPNFDNFKACAELIIRAQQYLDPFYKKILTEIISPYILQFGPNKKIDFTEFFTKILYDTNVSEIERKTITDIYMKVEQLEDFDNNELDELIDEQCDTLKEYVFTEIQADNLENSLELLDI